MLAGVIGGLAEYFDTDSTILRLLTVAAILVTGFFPGVLLYLIACVIVPLEEQGSRVHDV